MTDKIITLLGFAAKARVLRFGAAEATEAVKHRRAKGVFFAEDISAKSRKEIKFYCEKFDVEAHELKGIDMNSLSRAVGKKCGIVAVLDDNFNNPIISYLTSGREEIK